MPYYLNGCTCAPREVPPASYPFPRLKVKPPDPLIPFASRARNAVPGCLADLTQPFFSLAVREPRTKGDDVMWSLPTIFAGTDFLTNRKSARVQLFFLISRAHFPEWQARMAGDPFSHFRWVIAKKTTQSVAHGPTLPPDQPPHERCTLQVLKQSPRLPSLPTFPPASHTHFSLHPHHNHQQQHHHHFFFHQQLHLSSLQQWLALSRPPESPLVARPLASSSLPRLVSHFSSIAISTRHAS